MIIQSSLPLPLPPPPSLSLPPSLSPSPSPPPSPSPSLSLPLPPPLSPSPSPSLSPSPSPQVLDHRRGIPISLSAIYQSVAHSLGITLLPVNFPAHFLLKYPQDLAKYM